MVLRKKADVALETDSAAIRKMLGLDPAAQEFRVIYGAFASSPKEIAILTRSMFEIITDLAASIEVPPDHVAEKRVNPTPGFEAASGVPASPLIQIHSSAHQPADAFVAVPYHNYWFWIDDKDLSSKRLLTSLLFMFSLTETGEKEGLPIVTIPTN